MGLDLPQNETMNLLRKIISPIQNLESQKKSQDYEPTISSTVSNLNLQKPNHLGSATTWLPRSVSGSWRRQTRDSWLMCCLEVNVGGSYLFQLLVTTHFLVDLFAVCSYMVCRIPMIYCLLCVYTNIVQFIYTLYNII
jgi:hypothetical protein